MIQIDKIEGTDIFQFTIKGAINKESVEDFYNLLEVKATQHQKIKLLGIINEFPSFNDFKAFSSTIKMKAKAISNISKYAVLSNKGWLDSLLPVGNFLVPGIPMKHFNLNKKEDAIVWLEKDEDRNFSDEEYLSKMDVKKISDDAIYSFTIDGKIDEGGMAALYNIINDKSRKNKISLLAYYKNFDGFDSLSAFTEGLKVDFSAIGNIEKYAIVTEKKWARNLAEIEGKILPGITIKGFSEEEEQAALAWIKQ